MNAARCALFLVAACGRVAFDPSGGDGGVAGGGGDGSGDGGPIVDGSPARPNVAFVTSDVVTGEFGGLAQADALCMTAAARVPLPGTFRALLSTSTTNARDRFAGSRGWVRTDGVPFADSIDQLVLTRIYNPLDRDESGVAIDPATLSVWTGTTSNGSSDTSTCTDWTANPSEGGRIGVASAPSPLFESAGMDACASFQLHLDCLEVGFAVAQQPASTPSRIAFISNLTSNVGVAGLDAQCQSEATAAGLPGTYLAAVATKTATIASRFTIDSRPWTRVDGTVVAATGAAMFDGSTASSFVHQRADGTYIAAVQFGVGAANAQTTGTASSTCNDWNGLTGQAAMGTIGTLTAPLAMTGAFNCVSTMPGVMCLEQ